MAVVKEDKIVVARGYGVCKLGDATPLDENTMCGIASVTKVFTTAALATLVDTLLGRSRVPATSGLRDL